MGIPSKCQGNLGGIDTRLRDFDAVVKPLKAIRQLAPQMPENRPCPPPGLAPVPPTQLLPSFQALIQGIQNPSHDMPQQQLPPK